MPCRFKYVLSCDASSKCKYFASDVHHKGNSNQLIELILFITLVSQFTAISYYNNFVSSPKDFLIEVQLHTEPAVVASCKFTVPLDTKLPFIAL